MTLEVAVIGLYRIAGSLPALRWPLAGGILAIVCDLCDLYLMNVLDLGGIPDYQAFDKIADQVYLAVFLIVALRWHGLERKLSIVLYVLRMVGFVAFELTGERAILLLFPNVFEFWFLFVATLHHVRPGSSLRRVSFGRAALGGSALGGPALGASAPERAASGDASPGGPPPGGASLGGATLGRLPLVAAFVGLVVAKEVQEWALHWARLFDNVTFVDALDQIRRWLFGWLGTG